MTAAGSQDRVWRQASGYGAGATAQELGIPEDYYARIAAVEFAHWWHRGMREIAAALLGPRLGAPGLRVCDAGCGTGGVLRWMLARNPDARVAGTDISAQAISLASARAPDAELEVAPMHEMPFEDARFDVVLTNDVVQHVPEPQLEASGGELRRLLAPGGALLVRTNGGRRLERAREDWRRYDARALREWVEEAGMGVERVTYANLAGSAWAAARGAEPQAPTEERHGIPAASGSRARDPRFLALRAEAEWLAAPGRSLPYGHTLFALATRGA